MKQARSKPEVNRNRIGSKPEVDRKLLVWVISCRPETTGNNSKTLYDAPVKTFSQISLPKPEKTLLSENRKLLPIANFTG